MDLKSQAVGSAETENHGEIWADKVFTLRRNPSSFGAYRFYIVYHQSPLGPVDPSFQTLSGRLKLTVRRLKLDGDSLSSLAAVLNRGGGQSLILPQPGRLTTHVDMLDVWYKYIYFQANESPRSPHPDW